MSDFVRGRTQETSVREAGEADAADVAAIYARHVLEGTGSFEEEPPTVTEMTGRILAVRGFGLPFLVVESAAQILGFAYAHPFRSRSAFRHTIEDSVYVAPGSEGRGLGAALLGALLTRCQDGPWRQMIALIGGSSNVASIALHRRFGFREVGVLTEVGFKFGGWIDTPIMQRALKEGRDAYVDVTISGGNRS
jgi:L-amino acid N-acyltransferase YncA